MIVYNKLIRDRIPEIIQNEGKDFTVRTLPPKEYGIELRKKLQEEIKEFMEADSAEEIADIFEVLEYILREKGISIEEIFKIKENKKEKRGGFERRLFLESVEDD